MSTSPNRPAPSTEIPSEQEVKRRDRSFLARALLFVVVGFLLLQIVPYGRNQTNPPVVREPAWDSPQTRALAKRACFDCHSNETVWPWYAQIAPVSMLLQHDVDEGRKALNFSVWETGPRQQAEIEDMVATISKGQMPLPYYLILHPEARLGDAEKGQLINGLIATLGKSLESDELKETE
jgi:hypothetical protein